MQEILYSLIFNIYLIPYTFIYIRMYLFIYISYTCSFIQYLFTYVFLDLLNTDNSFVLKYLLIYLLNKIFYFNKCVFISFTKVNYLITTEPS